MALCLLGFGHVTTPPGPDPARPVPLSVREGRRAAAAGPHEGVPPHLEPVLRSWLLNFLTPELQQRVALHLGIALTPTGFIARRGGPPENLALHPEVDLLDVIDQALLLDRELPGQYARIIQEHKARVRSVGAPDGRVRAANDLSILLDDGHSVYRVARGGDGRLQLVRRVDPVVSDALSEAADVAHQTAGEQLRNAWVAAYARDPDPNTAYRDAVRAVETEIAAGGIISAKNPKPSLGTSIADLRNGAQKFELVLLDKTGDGSVIPLIQMMERLWQGQLSRHGGVVANRDQTLDEARAAVHLAAICVHWLATRVLRRRPTTASP